MLYTTGINTNNFGREVRIPPWWAFEFIYLLHKITRIDCWERLWIATERGWTQFDASRRGVEKVRAEISLLATKKQGTNRCGERVKDPAYVTPDLSYE